MIFNNVIRPNNEIIKYETMWANDKNSSLKSIINFKNFLFDLELKEKISSFLSKMEKDFIILTQNDIQFSKKSQRDLYKNSLL